MPRSTHSKHASKTPVTSPITETDLGEQIPMAASATATIENEEDTVRELPFTVDITPAEDGFKPDRSPAGRKRIPSPFETVLPELKGKGWQNQPHDGKVVASGDSGKVEIPDGVKESNARVILRELQKAVKFLNSEDGGELNLGLDVNVTDTLVQFNVRDKQNRKPRTPQGDDDSYDGETSGGDDDDEDSTGDE